MGCYFFNFLGKISTVGWDFIDGIMMCLGEC